MPLENEDKCEGHRRMTMQVSDTRRSLTSGAADFRVTCPHQLVHTLCYCVGKTVPSPVSSTPRHTLPPANDSLTTLPVYNLLYTCSNITLKRPCFCLSSTTTDFYGLEAEVLLYNTKLFETAGSERECDMIHLYHVHVWLNSNKDLQGRCVKGFG